MNKDEVLLDSYILTSFTAAFYACSDCILYIFTRQTSSPAVGYSQISVKEGGPDSRLNHH